MSPLGSDISVESAAADFGDWTQLLALLHRAFAYMVDRIDPPSSLLRMGVAEFQEKARRETLILARRGDVLLGCAFADLRSDCVYVGKVAVDDSVRGQGLLRRMMLLAERIALAHGRPFLELETRIELTENHAMFGALGFVKVAESAHAGFDRPTSITMRCSVPMSSNRAPSRKRLMSNIAHRLDTLGLRLPAPLQLPPGAVLPFPWVRVVGRRVLISGHGPTLDDGSIAGPFGKVGAQVSEAQAYESARLTALSILGSLQRELGDLDRIAAWVRVFGMVNSAPGFHRQPAVINGFSDLILSVFGPQVGAHARSAVGMAELPFNLPVEIEAEVELRSST